MSRSPVRCTRATSSSTGGSPARAWLACADRRLLARRDRRHAGDRRPPAHHRPADRRDRRVTAVSQLAVATRGNGRCAWSPIVLHGNPAPLRPPLGRAYGPDSSAAALAGALAAGVDGLETDGCLTADGELVLLHDPLLEVGTTLDRLGPRAHRRGDPRGPASRSRRQSDRRAPLLLDELLEPRRPATCRSRSRSRRTPTGSSPGALRGDLRALRGHPARHRIEVISFHSAACARGRLRLSGAAGRLRRLRAEALAAWAVSRGVDGRIGRALPAHARARRGVPPRRAQRQDRNRQRRRAPAPGRRARVRTPSARIVRPSSAPRR